jgi:hypothetical protein
VEFSIRGLSACDVTMKLLPVVLPGLSGLVGLAAVPCAQTLFVLEGASAGVRELSGPPDPAFCAYPNGPTKSQFGTGGAFPCALPGVAPPGELVGDVAVHRAKDTVWATDGDRIAEYDRTGTPVQSFGAPAPLLSGPVLGLGFDGLAQTLWLTDGAVALELVPPAVTCGVPTVASGPVPLPQLGPTPAAFTDVDVDPATGTLWICDAAGNVGNVTRQGALLAAFPATPGACGLQPPLTGLAVDASAGAAAQLFLTDGKRIAAVDGLTGGPASTTFAHPFACFPVPAGAVSGLGFSARPVFYGTGGGVLPPPEIGAVGEAVIPTTSLFVTLSAAQPGGLAVLPFSLAPLCPEIVVATVPILLFPQAFALFSQTVSAAGTAQVAIPIPPGTAPGIEAYFQWFVLGAGPAPLPDGPPILSSGAGSLRLGFQ